jgi:hypothetical protein
MFWWRQDRMARSATQGSLGHPGREKEGEIRESRRMLLDDLQEKSERDQYARERREGYHADGGPLKRVIDHRNTRAIEGRAIDRYNLQAKRRELVSGWVGGAKRREPYSRTDSPIIASHASPVGAIPRDHLHDAKDFMLRDDTRDNRRYIDHSGGCRSEVFSSGPGHMTQPIGARRHIGSLE